jgi:hypothetical protein
MKHLNQAKKFGSKVTFVVSSVGALSLASVGAAHAVLPAAVATAFTDLNTDAMDLIDLAWTVAVPITIGFIILGMFKRAARSAT